MNKSIIFGLMAATVHFNVAAQNVDVDLSKMKREINIMSNILKASFSEDKALSLRKVEAQYLNSQGITFTLDAKPFINSGFNLSDILPPEPLGEIDFNFDEAQIEQITEQAVSVSREAYHSALKLIKESSESIKQLAEQERDLEYEIRGLEREVRDVNFERRHAEKTEEKELAQRKQNLEQEVVALKKHKFSLDKEKDNLKKSLKARKDKNKQKNTQKRQVALDAIKVTLVQSLCDYGAGLRSLPNTENINFILSQAGENKKDVIYIFNKKDIKSCVSGDISAKKLLAKAVNYQF